MPGAAGRRVNTCCSMCQSSGLRRIPSVNQSATCCVIAPTPPAPLTVDTGSLKSIRSSGPL